MKLSRIALLKDRITVIATRLLLSFFHFSTLFKVANLILLRKICFVSNHDKTVHNICILLTQGQGMICCSDNIKEGFWELLFVINGS